MSQNKGNYSQLLTRNVNNSTSTKRWSVISPSITHNYHTNTIHSSRSERMKPTRNNQIISQNYNGEIIVIKNAYAKSFADIIDESRSSQAKNSTQCKELESKHEEDSREAEEQVTVIENDCENDYSVLLRSLNIQ